MLEAGVLILIGMFIGWHVPQPTWAKIIQHYVLSKINGLVNKK